ncbi:serine hydrolase [Flavivirga sp. 57AJ16]|uniref:serine hydrolase n=1 Tax=Flavivirga sp. 57AJ16 TaxID=3025307 RepID=UPI002366AEE9|nr:serine hydrolase [Flavivirga sp. 57AJ16]MDD7885077.1 serine hydrolase [Flavivirga sp. 57AJ16]
MYIRSKPNRLFLISLISFFLLATSCGAQRSTDLKLQDNQENNSPATRLDSLLIKLEKKVAPGVSVAVLHKGRIIYTKGTGLANLEYKVLITDSTIFHVASVSKQFTSFAIAMLADQGKLSLEDDIREYLPRMPDFGQKITLDHLVHHTSGLRDQWELLVLAGWRPDDVITDEQILNLVYHQKELDFNPGNEFRYSNTNYTLLAKIVERVTGRKFTDWTKENIFQPLQMNNSFFNDNHEKIVKNRAYSYAENEDGSYKKKVLNYSTIGATSLLTTAKDLMIWAQNFENIKVGSPWIMKKVHETTTLNNGKKTHYAFGQEISTYKGLPIVVHGGADAGFRTYLARFPEQNFAVAVLSNVMTFDTKQLAMKIVDECLTEAINTKSNFKKYTGEYLLQKGPVLNIWEDNKSLKVKIAGKNDSHNLVPMTDSQFNIPTLGAHVAFIKNDNNDIFQLHFMKGGQTIPGLKSNPLKSEKSDVDHNLNQTFLPIEKLKEYVGKYVVDKPLVMTIYLENDTLKGTVTGRDSHHPLLPLSESGFDVPSLNAKISFQRDSKGNVVQMTFIKEGRTIKAPKLDKLVLENLDKTAYMGKYYSKELSTFYNLIEKDGIIVARHPRHGDIPLEIADPDYFTSDWFIKEMKIIRDAHQNILGIKVSSNRVRNLWFEKLEQCPMATIE